MDRRCCLQSRIFVLMRSAFKFCRRLEKMFTRKMSLKQEFALESLSQRKMSEREMAVAAFRRKMFVYNFTKEIMILNKLLNLKKLFIHEFTKDGCFGKKNFLLERKKNGFGRKTLQTEMQNTEK